MSFGDQSDWGDITQKAMANVQKLEAQELEAEAEQVNSPAAFVEDAEGEGNPFADALRQKRKKTETPTARAQKMLKAHKVEKPVLPLAQIKETAEKFQQKNPELKANVLALLREHIKPDDTKEEILKTLKNFFQDVSLADEALEFLLETTDGELANQVKEAKEDFNKQYEREIKAGRNIAEQALAAASKGLGNTSSLKDMYRDITGNPRDSSTLFDQLSKKYGYKDLKKVIDFLLHSLGADMKAKGPSIPRGQLHRLFTETRSLQAILGVYRFFNQRMRLLNYQFKKEQIPLPPLLNFEKMAKEFMALARDRFPSPDKIKQSAERLGLNQYINGKIIALSQFRDAVKEVAMNQVYRSIQHRDDLYIAILEALEDLEDAWEEYLEQHPEEGGHGEEEPE